MIPSLWRWRRVTREELSFGGEEKRSCVFLDFFGLVVLVAVVAEQESVNSLGWFILLESVSTA